MILSRLTIGQKSGLCQVPFFFIENDDETGLFVLIYEQEHTALKIRRCSGYLNCGSRFKAVGHPNQTSRRI